jgi:hypothetical protein
MDRKQLEHNDGQYDGSQASAFDELVENLNPFTSDEYKKGFKHGRSQRINKRQDESTAYEENSDSNISELLLTLAAPLVRLFFILLGISLVFGLLAAGVNFIWGKLGFGETESVRVERFEGAAIVKTNGITYTKTPNGIGATFSRENESRIEFAFSKGFPREGTVEFLIKVDSGYQYSNYKPILTSDSALIFTTDIAGGDVSWPGSSWLWVSKNGDINFNIATKKYESPPMQILTARSTNFRFKTWHNIGISFGDQGQFIKLDGKVVASNSRNTQPLGGGGTHYRPVDAPTIGEAVSGFWNNNQHEGGFEGIVDRFRTSPIQQDWVLSLKNPNPIKE